MLHICDYSFIIGISIQIVAITQIEGIVEAKIQLLMQ